MHSNLLRALSKEISVVALPFSFPFPLRPRVSWESIRLAARRGLILSAVLSNTARLIEGRLVRLVVPRDKICYCPFLFRSRDAETASIRKAIFGILKIYVGKFISWDSFCFLAGNFIFTYSFEDMPESNYAFFGCGASRNHGLSMFKISSLRTDNAEHTSTLKREIRDELLRLILRTREMEPEFLKTYRCE